MAHLRRYWRLINWWLNLSQSAAIDRFTRSFSSMLVKLHIIFTLKSKIYFYDINSNLGKLRYLSFQDFYQYSCGGYLDRTRLSWRKSRYRENPDEMLEREAAYQIGTF